MTRARRRLAWHLTALFALVFAWAAVLALPAAGQADEVPADQQGTYEGEMENSAGQRADTNSVRIEVGATSSSGLIDFNFGGGGGGWCTGALWEWDSPYASFDTAGVYIRGNGVYRNAPCSYDPEPEEFELHLILGGGTALGQLYGEEGFVGGFDIPLVGGDTSSGGDDDDEAEDPPIIAVVGGIAAVAAAAAAASGIDPETGQKTDDEKPTRELSIVQVSADLLDVSEDSPATLTLTGWHSSESGLARVPMDLSIEVPLLSKGLKVTPTSGTGELQASVEFDPETFDENQPEVKLIAHGSWNGHEATKDVTVRLNAGFLLEWFS